MKVFILRGGSGSGKSTWAQQYGDIIISTDFFFLDENKNYKFNPSRIGEAHAETFKKFIGFCQNPPRGGTWGEDGKDLILVVDNTNTSIAEFAPYAQVAASYGHEVQILTFVYDPLAAFNRNIHGVSLTICMLQHMRLMRETSFIPSWWKHEFIVADDTAPDDEPPPEG
jgi:hypothetical protein